MKNILITIVLLFSFIIPSSSVFATNLQDTMQNYAEQQQIQGIINGLSGISNAINAQTKALKVAQKQQQIAALNQTCVSEAIAYIFSKDTYIKQTDQAIDDYMNEISHKDMSDPATAQQANSYLNYLYTLRERQSDSYFGYIIDSCTNYKVQLTCPSGYYLDAATGKKCITPNQQCVENYGPNAKVQDYDSVANKLTCGCISGSMWNTTQTTCVIQQVQQTTHEFQCNGKSWNDCGVGYNFYCPPSGDPSCVLQQKSLATTSVVKTKPENTPKTTVQTTLPKTNDSQIIKTGNNTIQPVNTTTPEKKGFWSWLKHLFGF